ncbi:hypothetical protein TH61_00580 [Rufibacter sp. DG15C]|uniref:hypothetical protein n=1 Tax=Rufibacter sp. DG15C TaxID=1379909 RepID=UPI00078D9E33|nr:hypothetical protein [Rufibacter sp. DG15C]AMM49974.1 hypothetical protein TH61_00580 [Rufibacter sp. DG15C]
MAQLLSFILLLFVIDGLAARPAGWLQKELLTANTGKDAAYLNQVERETLMYLNLARLYPKRFVELELAHYWGNDKHGNFLTNSSYKESLIKEMSSMQPVQAFYPDRVMSASARCFALEKERIGGRTHERLSCKTDRFAECISFGMDNGREIALQLLIDHLVPSLGHRWLCLNSDINKVGLGFAKHKTAGVSLVLEMDFYYTQ